MQPPCKLYDPSRVEMLALLDAEQHFPAPEFSRNASTLNMLRQLGLRVNAGLDTVLDSARLVQATSEEDSAMAFERGKVRDGCMGSWCS